MPQTHGVSIKPMLRAADFAVRQMWRFERVLERLFPYFWHPIRLQKDGPRHHRYATYEYEQPYRCAYSHVIRLAGTRGVALGRWHAGRLDADVAGFEAVKGHQTAVTEDVADRVRHFGWTVRPAPEENG